MPSEAVQAGRAGQGPAARRPLMNVCYPGRFNTFCTSACTPACTTKQAWQQQRRGAQARAPGVEGEALVVEARQVARQAQRGPDLLVLLAVHGWRGWQAGRGAGWRGAAWRGWEDGGGTVAKHWGWAGGAGGQAARVPLPRLQHCCVDAGSIKYKCCTNKGRTCGSSCRSKVPIQGQITLLILPGTKRKQSNHETRYSNVGE